MASATATMDLLAYYDQLEMCAESEEQLSRTRDGEPCNKVLYPYHNASGPDEKTTTIGSRIVTDRNKWGK
eukprot:1448860-Amphidinium_carterae.1